MSEVAVSSLAWPVMRAGMDFDLFGREALQSWDLAALKGFGFQSRTHRHPLAELEFQWADRLLFSRGWRQGQGRVRLNTDK